MARGEILRLISASAHFVREHGFEYINLKEEENNVSHTNNKKTSENDNIKSTPIDAKDQLTLLEQYQEFVKNANTQIDRVSKIHWTLLIILGLVIAVGIFFTYRTASDFKTEVRNDVEILKKEVVKRIDDELSKEELHKLITDKVSERITKIADGLIEQHIIANISPKIIELVHRSVYNIAMQQAFCYPI